MNVGAFGDGPFHAGEDAGAAARCAVSRPGSVSASQTAAASAGAALTASASRVAYVRVTSRPSAERRAERAAGAEPPS